MYRTWKGTWRVYRTWWGVPYLLGCNVPGGVYRTCRGVPYLAGCTVLVGMYRTWQGVPYLEGYTVPGGVYLSGGYSTSRYHSCCTVPARWVPARWAQYLRVPTMLYRTCWGVPTGWAQYLRVPHTCTVPVGCIYTSCGGTPLASSSHYLRHLQVHKRRVKPLV